jgi:DNA-binding response OmpR family regulator
VWTREELAARLYAAGAQVHSNAIEVHVHALRRKLAPQFIQSARGVGYLVRADA